VSEREVRASEHGRGFPGIADVLPAIAKRMMAAKAAAAASGKAASKAEMFSQLTVRANASPPPFFREEAPSAATDAALKLKNVRSFSEVRDDVGDAAAVVVEYDDDAAACCVAACRRLTSTKHR
jgi:hypothetical protein